MGWLKKAFKKSVGISSFGLVKEKQSERFADKYGKTAVTAGLGAALVATGVGAAFGAPLLAAAGTGATIGAAAAAGSVGGGVIGDKIAGDKGRLYGSMLGAAAGGIAGSSGIVGASALSTEAGTGLAGYSSATTAGAAAGLGGALGAQSGEAKYMAGKTEEPKLKAAPQAGEGAAMAATSASADAEVVDPAASFMKRASSRRRAIGLLGTSTGTQLGTAGQLGAGY